MSAIVILKLIHVLCAIVAVGSNVTYAFWLRSAGTDRRQLLFAINGVRVLDQHWPTCSSGSPPASRAEP